MALTCDIRIAADDTKFGAPEVKLSRVVNFAGLITQYVPKGIANELLLVGDPINPERAYQLGIFNMLVPGEELMPAATRLAERLCENGPVAMKSTKEILHRSEEIPSYDGKLSLAEAMYPSVATSEDYREGATAFKEKRKPVWKGR